MKLSEVYKIADEIAPKRLSDEYCRSAGAYDNSGLLVECCEEVTGIVCSLDLTNAAIDKAIANGANLIITHHLMHLSLFIYGNRNMDFLYTWQKNFLQ